MLPGGEVVMSEKLSIQATQREYVQPKIEVIPGSLIRSGNDNRVDFDDQPGDSPTGYATPS